MYYSEKPFYSKCRNVLVPYFISFLYRYKQPVPKIYNIRIRSTGMHMKMRLKVTGATAFPVVDTMLLRRLGRYEPDTSVVLRNELQDGNHVVELGAAVGYFTVQMSRYVGEKGCIYSFEPNKEFYNDLLFNLTLNMCRNVIAQNEGLGESNEELIDGDGNKFKTNSLKEFLFSTERIADFMFIDVDAKTADTAEARQEVCIVDIIADYVRRQQKKPKIFLEYILEDESFFDMKNKLLGVGYNVRQITKRHFLFK